VLIKPCGMVNAWPSGCQIINKVIVVVRQLYCGDVGTNSNRTTPVIQASGQVAHNWGDPSVLSCAKLHPFASVPTPKALLQVLRPHNIHLGSVTSYHLDTTIAAMVHELRALGALVEDNSLATWAGAKSASSSLSSSPPATWCNAIWDACHRANMVQLRTLSFQANQHLHGMWQLRKSASKSDNTSTQPKDNHHHKDDNRSLSSTTTITTTGIYMFAGRCGSIHVCTGA